MLRLLFVSLILSGCTYLHVPVPVHVDETDWPMEGRVPQRTQAVPEEHLTPPLKVVWRYNAHAGFGPASPLMVDGFIWVGTRKGEVHAIREETGKGVGARVFGEAIEGGMQLIGRLLLVPVARGRDALVAFDVVTGRVQWRFRSSPVEAGVLADGSRAFVADVRGTVYGLEPHGGRLLWQYAPDSVRYVRASPVALDSHRLAVAYDTGEVVALSMTDGREVWRTSVGAPVWRTPSVAGAYLFVPTTRGRCVALHVRTGAQVWVYRTEDPRVKFTTPATDGKRVVLGGTDGVVRALDVVSGEERWRFQTDGAIVGAPLIVGQVVYVGAMDKRFVALERDTGRLLWETTLAGRIKSAPAYARGMVVVLSEPRYVYGFRAQK